MRTHSRQFTLLSAVVLTALFVSTSAGADYEISWYTIDGGGGTSSGGAYSFTGTIGQPDADWSEGGGYELLGGCWPGGPLCFVEFDDFARFAQMWLNMDLAGDLDNDQDVDFGDLSEFADWWLCYCPVPWPLK